ncbi:MAG: tRNA (adenosine(37)-N6)-threonylcarbamoyltransferase complex ATPase subunit type 1 TsaE [Alphaproteobacteria bacterium]|nr:MAG: tRNA (adenosine(37)-N6)-threonylcarbamoyltransferase complex ATPase subunit type 1 TsaE [Alphaproteobacteria bacterium]
MLTLRPPLPGQYLCPELVFDCADETATAELARQVARYLLPGDLLRLEGDLGAGKSTFSRYLLQALGHSGDVPSPTYTLVQLYDTDLRVPVAHVDCYRLNDPAELDGLGLEAYRQHGVIVAEWPDKGGHLLAANQPDYLEYHIQEMNNPGVLTLRFETGTVEHARVVTLAGSRSWQRRFGLMFEAVRRPRTEAGQKTFLDGLGLTDYAVENLGGDWSFRSYWRVRLGDGSSRMLMDAPPPIEGVAEFAKVAAYYNAHGLRAPKEYGRDETQGYLLLEDFGSRNLLAAISEGGANKTDWYTVAVDALCHLCSVPKLDGGRSFTPRDWWIDAARFTDWYMPMVRGRATTVAERAHYMGLWQQLYGLMEGIPQGTMPWDYQATNMMLLGETPALANFGLIDIQDAKHTPIATDMAILLRDIRRAPDHALEAAMTAHAADRLGIDSGRLKDALDIASLHHCSRILGGLARIYVRDGKKAGPQRFIPRTWEVARQSYSNPLLAEVVAFMQEWEMPGLNLMAEAA